MMMLLRLVALVAFLSLVATAHVFLYRRLVRDVTTRKGVRYAAWAGIALVLGLGLFNSYRTRSGEDGFLPWLMPLWFGLFLNLLLAVLFAEVAIRARARWKKPVEPPSEERRLFLARAVAAGSVVAAGGLTSLGIYRAYTPAQITELPVRLPGLPKAMEGFTIAHLTDIHVGQVLRRQYIDALVDRANSVRADLVVITGDLVDGSTDQLGHIVSRISNLRSKYGTYFVTGNHDYYSGADDWASVLKGLGVTVLRNRHVRIGDAAASFDLLGVDDWRADYDLNRATEGQDPLRASVLLAHQPSNFDEVAQRGIGLQLSGHTHGGQMFPATYAAQLIWGDRNTGLSRTGESQLWVSRGCGFVGPSQRVGAPPEIGKLVLLPA